MYSAALRGQITAFPEKMLPTEMAPGRLISTPNEELIKGAGGTTGNTKPPPSTSSPDSPFWNHARGQGLKPNLSHIFLLYHSSSDHILPTYGQASVPSELTKPIPNLTLPKSPSTACVFGLPNK